jgi:hypothetical protein
MNKKDLEKLGLTAEALEKAGLTADVVESIIVLHGKDIEKHKGLIETAGTEATALKTQLIEANKTIDGFKAMKVEDIQKAADDWKIKAETAEADAKKIKEDNDAAMVKMKFDQVLGDALKAEKVQDPADVIPHLKMDMLKLGEDGKFVGLTEQLTPLKEHKSYLFKDDDDTPEIITGGNNKSVIGDAIVDVARKAAGLPVAGED